MLTLRVGIAASHHGVVTVAEAEDGDVSAAMAGKLAMRGRMLRDQWKALVEEASPSST